MSEPTNPGDVVITGQRRPTQAVNFPTRGDENPPQHPVDEPPPLEEGGQVDPCGNPLSKVIWNADSAAAEAVSDFVIKSMSIGDGPTLSNREFGSNLLRDASGSVSVGEVGYGSPAATGATADMVIPPGGATLLNWMGDIHFHPSGDGRPSFGEFLAFQMQVTEIVQNYPTRLAEMQHVAMYITVGNPPNHAIYAYKTDADINELGLEVNPQGAPC